MYCCAEGVDDIAFYLIKNGANIEGNFLETPVQAAQKNGHDDLALILKMKYNVPMNKGALKRPSSNRLKSSKK